MINPYQRRKKTNVIKDPPNDVIRKDRKVLFCFGDLFVGLIVISRKNYLPEFCHPQINNNKNCQ